MYAWAHIQKERAVGWEKKGDWSQIPFVCQRQQYMKLAKILQFTVQEWQNWRYQPKKKKTKLLPLDLWGRLLDHVY